MKKITVFLENTNETFKRGDIGAGMEREGILEKLKEHVTHRPFKLLLSRSS